MHFRIGDGKKEEDFETSVLWREGLYVGFTPPLGMYYLTYRFTRPV